MPLTVLALVALLGAAYVIVSLPWLWRRPPEPKQVSFANETVMFVSDLHLAKAENAPEDLAAILDLEKPANLVIVGDLFHSPRVASSDTEVERFVSTLLEKVDARNRIKRVLITTSENHDPRTDEKEVSLNIGHRSVLLTRSPLAIDVSGLDMLAIHGDFFCNDGLTTAAVELSFSSIGVQGAVERFVRNLMGLRSDRWIVMGHTHMALLNSELRVANCGSFHSHFLRSASSTAVMVKDGSVRLVSAQSNR